MKIEPGKDGKQSIPESDLPRYLVVKLRPDDAKPFMVLTERSVGKQLLVMLNNKPLTTWRGVGRFPEGRFDISFNDQTELKKTEGDLKKLIR